MYLSHAAAILTQIPPMLNEIPAVTQVDPQAARKSLSPASLYAQKAVERLSNTSCDAIITVTGPSGATSRAFDKAKALSSDGLLVSEGFAEKRSRRIHPLTLLHHLHNQPLAAVADITGCKGPGLSVRAAPQVMLGLLANIAAILQEQSALLLVFCEAANREEERTKAIAVEACPQVLEGAVAIRLTSQPIGAHIRRITTENHQPLEAISWGKQCGLQALNAGLDLLRAFHKCQFSNTPIATPDGICAVAKMEYNQ